jgi:hypothetical protein
MKAYPHSIRRNEYGTGSRRLTISTAQLDAATYETICMTATGHELDLIRAGCLIDALANHESMLERFAHAAEAAEAASLTPKMRALIDALKAAADAGRAAVTGDDGGTCNFDSAALFLPGWRAADIEICARRAGLRCFDTRFLGRRAWIVSKPLPAQGNDNTRQAEAMTAALQAAGYTCGTYYQMD